MGNQSWTLTVSYVNGVATIRDSSGGSGDETIYVGEADTITFQPGAGVQAITGFSVTRPVPLPSGVSVTSVVSGANCTVTDTDTLAATAAEVDCAYCVYFTDSNGIARSTDPQLINKPTVRPDIMLMPAARSARSPAAIKPSAATPAKPAAKPAFAPPRSGGPS